MSKCVRERVPWLVWQHQCQTLSRASTAQCVCVCVLCVYSSICMAASFCSLPFLFLQFLSFSLSSSFLCCSLSSKNSDPCIRWVWQMTVGADNPLSACAATVNNAVPCHRTTLAKAHISYPSQKLLLNSPFLPILLNVSPYPPRIPPPKLHPDMFLVLQMTRTSLGEVIAAYFKVKSSTQWNLGPNVMCFSPCPWIQSKWWVTDLAVLL